MTRPSMKTPFQFTNNDVNLPCVCLSASYPASSQLLKLQRALAKLKPLEEAGKEAVSMLVQVACEELADENEEDEDGEEEEEEEEEEESDDEEGEEGQNDAVEEDNEDGASSEEETPKARKARLAAAKRSAAEAAFASKAKGAGAGGGGGEDKAAVKKRLRRAGALVGTEVQKRGLAKNTVANYSKLASEHG